MYNVKKLICQGLVTLYCPTHMYCWRHQSSFWTGCYLFESALKLQVKIVLIFCPFFFNYVHSKGSSFSIRNWSYNKKKNGTETLFTKRQKMDASGLKILDLKSYLEHSQRKVFCMPWVQLTVVWVKKLWQNQGYSLGGDWGIPLHLFLHCLQIWKKLKI